MSSSTEEQSILTRCLELSKISEEPDRLTRSYLSPAMDEAMAMVAQWMQEAGLETELDRAGNLIGIRQSKLPEAPVLVLGSHLDTVRDAGCYDGPLGVLLAIAVAEELADTALPFDLEVIAFADEEGLRFGVPFLGSKALIGELESQALDFTDGEGISIEQAMQDWNRGLSNTKAGDFAIAELQCRYRGRKSLGYLEAHIEQGPLLEQEQLPLGILEALAGSSWHRLRFTGRAGHAGTTPMALRFDAMPAAAEAVLAAERIGNAHEQLVATVGRFEATPGAGNVIAGSVDLWLDMRHPDEALLNQAVGEMLDACREIATKRGLTFDTESLHREDGVVAAPELSQTLAEAAEDVGIETGNLVIGAGHDALIMARRMPMTMLLLRCPGGISHHPEESVVPEDVDAAFRVMVAFVKRLAEKNAPEIMSRSEHASELLNLPPSSAIGASSEVDDDPFSQ